MQLVVGATGLLGSEICRQLRERDCRTRALVRPGSPREFALRKLDVDVVYGDLKDPTSLAAACGGVSTVISTANSAASRRSGDSLESVDRDGTLALVSAAVAADVSRFVYLSVSPVLRADNPFVNYKREVERTLQRGPMAWTVLQPAAFMEVHAGSLGGWDFARSRARIVGSGHAVIAYISIRDVAAFAVAAAALPAAARRFLHITGPEPLTARDAVAIAERVTGRHFRVQRLPVPVVRLARTLVTPFNPLVGSFMAMGIAMEKGERVEMDRRLFREFDVTPTLFEQYVRRSSPLATSDPFCA